MKKSNIKLIAAGILLVSSIGVANVSLAAYIDGKILNNPTKSTPTELSIETDFSSKIDAVFTLKCKTTTGKIAYIRDETHSKNVAMTYVSSNASPSYDVYTATIEVDADTDFSYRYFIANEDNPNTVAQVETGNTGNTRTVQFSTSKTTQDDNWHIGVNFTVNYDTHSNSMWVRGGFNSWAQDSDSLMNWTDGNDWKKSIVIDFAQESSYYEYKYYTNYNSIGYETGSNRSITTLYQNNSIGVVDITRPWGS